MIALFAVAALAGCADYEVGFNRSTAPDGASSALEDRRPDWLRDPARGEYPYSPKGW
ncbi:MAG TPA: hypothetical protein VGX52_07410 [Burkholderiales bacterium]|nr:hypothetical protein [Burkholderiales bacterium]